MVNFGDWDPAIHSEVEQVQRILSAKEKKLQSGIISRELQSNSPSITIQGSGADPYIATLNECSCSDFVHRKLPCKHIYALAFELCLMDGLPKFKKSTAVIDADSELLKYRTLYESGNLKAEDYVLIGKALSKLK